MTKQTGSFSLMLLALLGAFYLPWLLGWQSFYRADLTYYFEPFSKFIAEEFRHGRLPLWNPYLYCGMSQVAVPSPGIFYPLTWLFCFGSFSQALAAFLMAHQFFAGMGAFLLVASLGWSWPAAAVAGFACALCGYMFAFSSNYTLVASAAWLPLLLYALKKIGPSFVHANIGYVFLASFTTFLMVAAGRPEVAAPAFLIAVMAVVLQAIVAYREDLVLTKSAVKQLWWRLFAMATGVVLAMPVILPALEWMQLSPRSQGLELKWVLMWSANWYDLIGIIFAQPLGDLTILGVKFLNLVAARSSAIPFLTTAFVGPVIFTLAIWGAFDKTFKGRFWVLFVLVGSILMALGNHTPIAGWVSSVAPFLSSFRYPVKLLIFPVMCLALLAARGMQLSVENRAGWKSVVFTTSFWTVVLCAGTAFVLSPDLAMVWKQIPWWTQPRIFNLDVLREAQLLFGKVFITSAVLGLVVCASVAYKRTGKITSGGFAAIVIGAAVGTMFAAAFEHSRPGTTSNFFERPIPLTDTLRQLLTKEGNGYGARIQPLYFDPLTTSAIIRGEATESFEVNFYQYARQLLLPNGNVAVRIPYSFGYEAAEEGRFKTLFSEALTVSAANRGREASISDAPMARFCDLTSTSHVLTQVFYDEPPKPVQPLDPKFFKVIKEDRFNNIRIYECLVKRPRAYFATDVESGVSWDEFHRSFQSGRPLRLTSMTLVEDAFLRTAQPFGSPSTELLDPLAPTKISPYRTEGIAFAVDHPGHQILKIAPAGRTDGALLVVNDHWYPGWEAYVDGTHVPLHRVNFFFRGVVVPPGAHTVEFSYRPASVTAGLAANALVFLVFIALFLAARRRSGPVPSPTTASPAGSG